MTHPDPGRAHAFAEGLRAFVESDEFVAHLEALRKRREEAQRRPKPWYLRAWVPWLVAAVGVALGVLVAVVR